MVASYTRYSLGNLVKVAAKASTQASERARGGCAKCTHMISKLTDMWKENDYCGEKQHFLLLYQ